MFPQPERLLINAPYFHFPLPDETYLCDQEMRPVNQSSQPLCAAAFLHATVRLEMRWAGWGGGGFFFSPFFFSSNYISSSFLLLPALGDRSSLKCCPRCFHTLNFPRWDRVIVPWAATARLMAAGEDSWERCVSCEQQIAKTPLT